MTETISSGEREKLLVVPGSYVLFGFRVKGTRPPEREGKPSDYDVIFYPPEIDPKDGLLPEEFDVMSQYKSSFLDNTSSGSCPL